jgi:hypothetical protein
VSLEGAFAIPGVPTDDNHLLRRAEGLRELIEEKAVPPLLLNTPHILNSPPSPRRVEVAQGIFEFDIARQVLAVRFQCKRPAVS